MSNEISINKINTDTAYLLITNDNNNRAFIQSNNINVFPCSRRGHFTDGTLKYYDPEARLNTERTNRLNTALNGFKDDFIITNEANTLVFVLAGYYIEVKNFNPDDIAATLGTDTNTIYAHLSLHKGISLNVENYTTEILYRQSEQTTDANYLDVSYTDDNIIEDFFVGISFTKEEIDDNVDEIILLSHNLKLFSKSDNTWKLEQASLLPKIEHGETEDSIIINGELIAKETDVDSLTVKGTTWLQSKAQIDGEATLYNKLLIKSSDTTRAEIDSSKASFNLPTVINNTLTVSKPEGTDAPAAKVTGNLEVNSTISTEIINVNTLQSVDTIKTDRAEGLLITSTHATPERTLKIEGKTHITDSVTVPTVDVKTIKNTATDSTGATLGVSVDDSLSVTDNINVGTPTTLATVNSGCIVAKNEIIAENRLRVPGTFRAEAAEETVHIQNLAVVEKVTTPTLSVNTVTSDSDAITLDKKLTLGTNTSITTPVANVHSTLNVTNSAKNAKADIDVLESDKAVIGDLEVKTGLNNSTGKIIAKEVTADKITQNGKAIPVIDLVGNGTTYQLQITLDASKKES